MSKYYDPWAHKMQIGFTRFFQFIFLTLILGLVIWYFWVSRYFEADLWDYTKEAMFGDSKFLKALFKMCFLSSALFSLLIFTLLMRGKSQTGDNHYRGSRINNDY